MLVVEDESIIALELEEHLTGMGYEVVGRASSGVEAIAKARELRPDLILMDIVMPGEKNGIDAAEEIKSEMDVPVIFVTAYADEEFIKKAKMVGPFGYILKPYEDRELRAGIEVALYKKEIERQLQTAHDGLAKANEQLRQEIGERTRAEDQIKASLKEKEVLLREIHHRVKNNLQIISSLLSMQARKAKDENVIMSLSDSGSRIHTMSLIHAQLYQSENLEQVEMGTAIRKLVSFLSQIYARDKKNITSVVTAEGIILSISQAIPCGLIINELVSNALKHAFKGMAEGSIEISMRELADDKIKLTVKDNGIGIPEELDIYKTDTLGLKLIRTLAEDQLKGKMELIRNEGTEIYVEFKSITNGK